MSLTLICGPMFSGKTNYLINVITTSDIIPILAINHSLDNRYSHEDLHSHNGNKCPCIKTNDLLSITKLPEYKQAQVIIIDECNFFSHLVPAVLHMVEKDHKKVFAAKLNSTFERTPFGEFHNLFCVADDIVFLKGTCADCQDGTPSIFSKLIIDEPHQPDDIIVGGKEKYKPVCRKHFL